jgi:hypothetical protein
VLPRAISFFNRALSSRIRYPNPSPHIQRSGTTVGEAFRIFPFLFEWTFRGIVLYCNCLKQMKSIIKHDRPDQGQAGSLLHAWLNMNKGNPAMTKSLDVITETIRNPKHPFRKVDNQPKKPLKHRYERRKIKEYLHLGDWVTIEAT